MLEINGLKVYDNGNQNGKTLLFVHGFPLTSNMWKYQTEYFIKDHRCITYDIRGLGNSSAGDGQFTMEYFVDDLIYIVNTLELDKPILCGLSMGGYISLRAVEKYPQLFGGLILMDTRSEADSNEGKLKRAAGIKRINEEGAMPFISDFVPNCFYKSSIERLGDKYISFLEEAKSNSAIGVKGSLLAMLSRTDTTEFLSQIEIPTLLICGEFDALTSPPVMKSMADKIPNSTFEVIPDCGHLSPYESGDKVNEVMDRFLLKL
ncbi:MAG: alpha/beta hydrolase [Ignavibacteriaceae bacterium]|nr:alpha/beta hydrolase [Ignavibacteriaceae bacterium]